MTRRAGLDHKTVVEEAAKLVNEEGAEQLSLGRLAERLGIRTPSLYNHVAGLPGLKQDLAVYCFQELLARLTRATIGKSGRAAIFALADAYHNYAREAPGLYLLSQTPEAENEEVQHWARQIVDVCLAVLAPYNLSEEEAIHAVRGLRSIVHGFFSLEAVGGFGIPIDLDASFHWLVELYVTGLEQQKKGN